MHVCQHREGMFHIRCWCGGPGQVWGGQGGRQGGGREAVGGVDGPQSMRASRSRTGSGGDDGSSQRGSALPCPALPAHLRGAAQGRPPTPRAPTRGRCAARPWAPPAARCAPQTAACSPGPRTQRRQDRARRLPARRRPARRRHAAPCTPGAGLRLQTRAALAALFDDAKAGRLRSVAGAAAAADYDVAAGDAAAAGQDAEEAQMVAAATALKV